MRVAVFSGNVDSDITSLWNRINLALILHSLPSEIDNEAYKDMQALRVILNAREEYKERKRGD